MSFHVSVICATESTRAALLAHPPASPDVRLLCQVGGEQALAQVLQRDRPDLLLLELPPGSEGALDAVEAAVNRCPASRVVLVSAEHSMEFLKQAMRAGVREVLPAPLSGALLVQAIGTAQGHAPDRADGTQRDSHVLALMPAKGGAGATFLSANLAFALSKLGQQVALLDLNLNCGDVAMLLGDRKGKTSVVELAAQTQRLDGDLLDSSMIRINDCLHVLAAPEAPQEVGKVPVEGLSRVLEVARHRYDHVLLSLGSVLDPTTVKALDMADSVALVVQMNVPFVHAAKRMADTFRELGYPAGKVSLVANRYERKGAITVAEVEAATGLKVGHTISNSFEACNASVNQGVPMLELAPHDSVTRELAAWARQLAAVEPQQTGGGWRRRIHNLVSHLPLGGQSEPNPPLADGHPEHN
jgi:pilus assembly protein CpaE